MLGGERVDRDGGRDAVRGQRVEHPEDADAVAVLEQATRVISGPTAARTRLIASSIISGRAAS